MTQLPTIVTLARRELTERARSRAFQWSTGLLVVMVLAVVALPFVFGGGTDRYKVGTVGDVPAGFGPVLQQLADAGDEELQIDVAAVGDRQAGKTALADGQVDAVVVDGDRILWQEDPDDRLDALLRSALTQATLTDRARELGIAPGQLSRLLRPAAIETASVEPTTEDRAAQMLVATVGLVLLFATLMFYGSFVLMGVIEEKSTRVVEVLLARVRPHQLLAGKVLGIGVLGLIQMSLLATVAISVLMVTDPVDLPASTYPTIASVVLWFVLGFAFYSVVYAALGSLASRVEDAQAAVGPLTVLLMGGYFLAFTSLDNPDGVVARVGSFFPPTAPLLMPLRTALANPAGWEIAVAVAITIAGTWAVTRLGGRLYRSALLQTGPKLTIRQAWSRT